MNRTTRPKVKKEIKNTNNSINQPDLTDIYRTLYPITANYSFFSSKDNTLEH